MSCHSHLVAVSMCASEMMRNAVYIQKELLNLDMHPEIRASIHELYSEGISTKHDVTNRRLERLRTEVASETVGNPSQVLSIAHSSTTCRESPESGTRGSGESV